MAKKARVVDKKDFKVKGKKRKLTFAIVVLLGVLLDFYLGKFPICTLIGVGIGLVILGLAKFTRK